MSDFLADWYSSYLRVMGEPSFLDISHDRSVVAYRFIWLRSFNHPIAIRISIRPDGSASLIGKVTSGEGGYEPGSLTWNEPFEISKQQVQLFLRLLNKTAFWSAPTEQSNGGMDGAEWIIEGVERGNYHVVDRWRPRQGDYVDMCLYLVNLSKIQLTAKEIY